MHHQDHRTRAQFLQHLFDHSALRGRHCGLFPQTRTPAMTRTIDQDYAMARGQHVAERVAHHFQIRARAVDHDNRRASGIFRPEVDGVEARARNLDRLTARRETILKQENARLRRERENRQRRNEDGGDHAENPDGCSDMEVPGGARMSIHSTRVLGFGASHSLAAGLWRNVKTRGTGKMTVFVRTGFGGFWEITEPIANVKRLTPAASPPPRPAYPHYPQQ